MKTVLKLLLIVLGLPYRITFPFSEELHARVFLTGPSSASGLLDLKQTAYGLSIEGTVSGLSPGKHDFHIHQWGDLSNGCDSTGPHFHPEHTRHEDFEATIDHLNEMGNIEANENGQAEIRIMDHQLTLFGPDSIVGRAYVIHAGTDNPGEGVNDGSTIDDNAGARLACGIVGLAP